MPERSVTSSKVPSPRLWNKRSPEPRDGDPRVGGTGEGAALDAVDVEPAVAVVVEQREPAAEGLGQLVEGRLGVVVDEPQADGLGIVGEGEPVGGPRALARATGAGRRRGLGPGLDVRGEGEPCRSASARSSRARPSRAEGSPGSALSAQAYKARASCRRPAASASRASSDRSAAVRGGSSRQRRSR